MRSMILKEWSAVGESHGNIVPPGAVVNGSIEEGVHPFAECPGDGGRGLCLSFFEDYRHRCTVENVRPST